MGLSVDDLVYTQAPKYLCELGDAIEFIGYGEEQCRQLGIKDDAEIADFLFQAFEGKYVHGICRCPRMYVQAG